MALVTLSQVLLHRQAGGQTDRQTDTDRQTERQRGWQPLLKKVPLILIVVVLAPFSLNVVSSWNGAITVRHQRMRPLHDSSVRAVNVPCLGYASINVIYSPLIRRILCLYMHRSLLELSSDWTLLSNGSCHSNSSTSLNDNWYHRSQKLLWGVGWGSLLLIWGSVRLLWWLLGNLWWKCQLRLGMLLLRHKLVRKGRRRCLRRGGWCLRASVLLNDWGCDIFGNGTVRELLVRRLSWWHNVTLVLLRGGRLSAVSLALYQWPHLRLHAGMR